MVGAHRLSDLLLFLRWFASTGQLVCKVVPCMCGMGMCRAALSSRSRGPVPINEANFILNEAMLRTTAGHVLASWITAFLFLPSLSYKLAEAPINITNANETAAKAIGDLMGKNLLHDAKEVNGMESPTNDTNATSGLGDLAKNLEFLMLKVAQLETLVELQQAELTAQQGELESVKKHVGLTASVSMAQRSKVKVQDAHDVLKRVLLKHHRQRETREYHEAADNAAKAQKAPGEKEALLQRQNSQSEQQSLDSSVSSKSIPFYDEVADAATAAYDTAVQTADGTGLTGDALKDAFNTVKDQGKAVEFIQNTVIDTVEKATAILLNYRGFHFSQNCRVDSPSVQMLGQTLRIHFGGQYCSITLVGQTVTLFNVNHGHRDVHFPSPLDWLPSSVRTLAGA
ncbi:unnamed protein product, partial [Effrenium voratum]